MRMVVWGGADGGTHGEGRAPTLLIGIWGPKRDRQSWDVRHVTGGRCRLNPV